MSSSSNSNNDQHYSRSTGKCCGGWGKSGNWSGINIAAMVLGFVLFWPIGLFILFWIITGKNVQDLPQKVREQWSKMTGYRYSNKNDSDNSVFTDFQEAQYDRIREIKEEVKERTRRFSEFRANARRRADEEEFNRFMSDAPE